MDPNPAAQRRDAKKIEEQAADAIRKALPPEYVAELEGRSEESRKRRKIEGTFGLEGYEAPDDVWYEKEKAEWAAQQRGLTGGREPKLIEGEERHPIQDERVDENAEDGAEEAGDGILSGSTLAALKSRQTASTITTAKAAKSAGPLVGYGTDSEGDEDE